jgi:AcrR family transcriptional regulator
VDVLTRTQGWASTTMSHVAEVAGVSRQTVYNEFKNRAALVEAYLRREIDGLILAVEAAIASQADDAHAALRSAFELFLSLASDEPVVQMLRSSTEGVELWPVLTAMSRAVALERLTPVIVRTWPQASVAEADLLMDALVRLAISHALLPVTDPAQIADGIDRLVGGYVDAIVAI